MASDAPADTTQSSGTSTRSEADRERSGLASVEDLHASAWFTPAPPLERRASGRLAIADPDRTERRRTLLAELERERDRAGGGGSPPGEPDPLADVCPWSAPPQPTPVESQPATDNRPGGEIASHVVGKEPAS
jgi:hypothetical protein